MASMESIPTNVKLGMGRVALDCVLSSGLYMFYWFYLTWKQLRDATDKPHYPVWHALALFVPIYGWFIIIHHLRTIKGLQDKAEIKPSLNPGGLLGLVIISNVLFFQSVRWEGMVAFVLDIIGVALVVVFLVVSQNNLNRYWEHVNGTQLREARIGVGEVIFVLIGLLIWASYLL